jgi:hypothetical protein
MRTFKTGDLVAKTLPSRKKPLQIGLVINDNEITFTVKWMSFDKQFFMEKEGDIFQELNNSYLLDVVQFHHNNKEPFLVLLNSNYCDGRI